MNYFKQAFLLSICVLFTSCATLFNGKYQAVSIDVNDSDTVYVDGNKTKVSDGAILLKRDKASKQITVKSKEYHDQNVVVKPYKKSPLYMLSIFPGLLLFYPPFLDFGLKSWDYQDSIAIEENRIKNITAKDTELRQLMVNEVAVELKADSITLKQFSSYKKYLENKYYKTEKLSDDEDDVSFTSQQLSRMLNYALAEKGYIDTNNRVLHFNYYNSAKLNATITDITIHKLGSYYSGFVFIDLGIQWEVLDIYNSPLKSTYTRTRSGQFIYSLSSSEQPLESCIKDGLEIGLIELMGKDDISEYLKDNSDEDRTLDLNVLSIPKTTNHVDDLGQAIKSSVTIKTPKGFGSGFFISEDGYVLTNYHVITDTSDITVVLNDKSEFKARVVRVSKSHDLALLKIEGDNYVPFNLLNSKAIPIASDVYAVGTPTSQDLSQTISRGIISGVRENGHTKLIQTDASINGGNSGGPMVLKNGQVLGIVSSKLQGFGVEGMAFAIPAYEVFEQLRIQYK